MSSDPIEKCDHCGLAGKLGPEIRAYSFETPKGKRVVRLLHGIDTGKPCAAEYHDKYRTFMREQRAKAGV
jgi:hypothetical protein